MSDHKIDHTLKAKSDDPVCHLHEYDIDLQSNHIYLFGAEIYAAGNGGDHDFDPGTEYVLANRFIRNLNLCMRVNPNVPILIHMKINGGYWEEGMAIYDAIKSCPFPVTMLCYTQASSMSSLIFQAANKRIMMPHAHFMFHDGTLGIPDNTVKAVESFVEFNKISKQQANEIYVKAMKSSGRFKNRSKKWLAAWLQERQDRKEDVYLTATQAVEFGFADAVFDYNWQKLTQYSAEELQRG